MKEIVLCIATNIIFWCTDWPVLAVCLLSKIKFDELLELVVGASRPIGKPVDCLSLADQAQAQQQEGQVEVVLCLRSVILVNARHEHPKGQGIQGINCLLIRIRMRVGSSMLKILNHELLPDLENERAAKS